MKSRIVWKQGMTGGKWDERPAPHQRKGGTCEFAGRTYAFDELPGKVWVAGGKVMHQRFQDGGFVNSCSLDDAVAVIDGNGRQLYPAVPPR